jgi:hypothetical protein
LQSLFQGLHYSFFSPLVRLVDAKGAKEQADLPQKLVLFGARRTTAKVILDGQHLLAGKPVVQIGCNQFLYFAADHAYKFLSTVRVTSIMVVTPWRRATG